MPADLFEHIAERATLAGVSPDADVLARCVTYLELLAKWNRRMNLTALPLAPPTDAAIDRLIVEPLIAAQHLRRDDATLIDLGSGGGSPAIPLAIAAPWIHLTMVEVREKKAAFLREAARATALPAATVLSLRVEDLRDTRVDVVSARAIKLNDQIAQRLMEILGTSGRFFWFRSAADQDDVLSPSDWQGAGEIPLPSGTLTIVRMK